MSSKLIEAQNAQKPFTPPTLRANAAKPIRATVISVLALAACLLTPPAGTTTDDPITRPLLVVQGHLTITVDLTGAYTFTDWGWASEVGLYTNTGSGGPGALDLNSGEFLAGSGVVVAANGDTLEWTIGAPNTVVYTGGTGRFDGVTGGFVAVITSVTPLSSTATSETFAITYEGNGTITY